MVTDIDEQLARLKDLNSAVPQILESPPFRVIMIKDPDGNSLAFAQAREGH